MSFNIITPEGEKGFLVPDGGAEGQVLKKTAEGWAWPVYADLPHTFEPFELFSGPDGAFFSTHPCKEMVLPETETLSYQPAGLFRTFPYAQAAAITTGYHLWNWYQQNRLCGCCGKPNMPDEKQRALRCTSCGNLRFPMIAPAVMVAITSGDQILLAKSLNSPTGRYGLIAGFVEVGETLEHAAHREVMEEAGIRISSLSYLGDQPWGFGGSHMFVFKAEADAAQPIVIQESELADVRWFRRDELEHPGHIVSIAHVLIERFRNGQL